MNALFFYSDLGYVPTTVPFVVDEDVSAVTRPEYSLDIYHSIDKVYVASAEQSFLQMIKDGNLPVHDKLMALTPCVRDEMQLDDITYMTFIKLELFVKGSHLTEVINEVTRFFLSINIIPEVVPTYIGFDLRVNGIEVGSYGVREYLGLVYTYGTGIAEPRLTSALQV
jgi:hypothetical protein